MLRETRVIIGFMNEMTSSRLPIVANPFTLYQTRSLQRHLCGATCSTVPAARIEERKGYKDAQNTPKGTGVMSSERPGSDGTVKKELAALKREESPQVW